MKYQKTVIVVVTPVFECWSNFKKLCEAKEELPYNYIKSWKFPIRYKNWVIHKMEIN